MRVDKARSIMEDLEHYCHHDRVLLNNPVVMQGMGLAPLVIIASNAKNAVMLCVAVLLLLTPTRILCSLLLRRVNSPLPRAIGYAGAASVVYIGVYLVLNRLFGTELLALGIYLPMLVVEPLIIYRFGRVPENLPKAVYKGLRITVGYALILLLMGFGRELLGTGCLFGNQIMSKALLPMLAMPSGGFILLGVICAVWRSLVAQYKRYVAMEAKREG